MKSKILLLAGMFALATSVQADEVVKAVPDNTLGQAVGGWSAFLIGGAVGGPVGAVIGGIAGAWSGGHIQQATDNSENGYLVQAENGSRQYIRSPNQAFTVGDQVKITGIRIIADENQSMAKASPE
ncbi:hypothetical protein SG34_028105 [Thalassomonas viridans]|uniref:Glycine zipper domain-containing protein n=1 Tax=Thalassomonas viridans TaxID=137584 RepID=A0AAF0C959_9GAMM|nr:hypothetical protein [Thalassomonas viridans]WDE05116.1 hypothetical protein SG34_028105 [Thalassomonas viridans]